VQLGQFQAADEIFNDEYAYFSSYSKSWLEHARQYSLKVIERFGFDQDSLVVEIASNDGYLLRNFKEKGIKILGVEPCANVAKAAEEIGIPSLIKFFGVKMAEEMVEDGIRADLLVGNNVLAHVPDLNDFVKGMKILLSPQGVITMEFPHLKKLIEFNQFDTIYHEHFSYFSLLTVERVFAAFGLVIFDVEEIPTHGGSLRIYARHDSDTSKPVLEAVNNLREQEIEAGFKDTGVYARFAEQVKETKRKLLSFLIEVKRQGKTVVGYGAPAKGNTLLNYCGIGPDFIDYTVDLSPHKQGLCLPGTHLPIFPPERINETKPDYVLILPWNLKEEVMNQMAHIREWGGQFVVPIPELKVYK
ncbi:MAG: class I SAM-dependent methyltransferase, partial [Pseudomonadota bacterium]|nr:class I SAM-dependent methyltransferase [Pseudomonadota bacterium]